MFLMAHSNSMRIFAVTFALSVCSSSAIVSQMPQLAEEERRLLVENQALRAELARWQQVGDRVAAREAWAAETLSNVGIPLMPHNAMDAASLADTTGQQPYRLESRPSMLANQGWAGQMQQLPSNYPQAQQTQTVQADHLTPEDPVLAQASHASQALAVATNQHAATRVAPSVALPTSSRVAEKQPVTAAAVASVSSNATASASSLSLLSTWRSWSSAVELPAAASAIPLNVVAVCIVAVFAVILFQALSTSRGMMGASTYQHLLRGMCSKRMDGALRRVGIAPYNVELSEIHLGSLFSGQKVCVRFSGPVSLEGEDHVTETICRSDGAFMRFSDNFVFQIRSTDMPLLLSVLDERGEVARLQLDAKELIELSRRPHQQYFRSELSTLCPLKPSADGQPRRPYVAMRIRDTTSPLAQAKMAPYGSYGSSATAIA